MKYVIGDNAIKHTMSHFDESNSVGSCFRKDCFPSLDSLMETIYNIEPIGHYKGSLNRASNVYFILNLEFVGWIGLGKKQDYPNHIIKHQLRNGFSTQYLEVEDLPKTSFVTVVYQKLNEGNQLITTFPGPYAPAFPHTQMALDEFEFASEFWNDHILLKRQSHSRDSKVL
jgi:hypothetical protein